MGEPDLEFVWVGDDAIDPLQQAQTLNILVSAGIKTRDEARAELGLGGDGPKAGLGKFNPYHDPSNGWFTTAEGAGNPDGAVKPTPVAERASSETPAGHKLPPKIQRGMEKRGWTAEQIDQAVKLGNCIDAINKENGRPATRYVNPDTGKSVVIDNATDEVIHIGEEGVEYGPGSGDVPGAVMRLPLSSENSPGSAVPPSSANPNSPTLPTAPVEPTKPMDPIFPMEPLP